MATNELAAILARRRAKEGGEDSVPSVERSSSSSSETAPAEQANGAVTAPTSTPRTSIAERIARLKQQSAAAGDAPSPVQFPLPVQHQRYVEPTATREGDSGSTESSSASPEQRSSNRIQQLQGNLGINVNPFGNPPGGYRRATGGGSSIMSTGDQYEYQHGRGAAIPMPGLAKAGFRLPGMGAPEGNSESEHTAAAASLEESHATMNRVAGPKRRGPTRPPPGAVRMPGIGPSTPAQPTEEVPPTATKNTTDDLFGASDVQPVETSMNALHINDTQSDNLFGSPDSAPALALAPTLAPVGFTPPPMQTSAAQDDASSESDWSDNDDKDQGGLFGAPLPRTATPAPAPAPTPAPVLTPTPAPASYHVDSSDDLFGSPTPAHTDSSSDLFGSSPAATPPAPAPAPVLKTSSSNDLFGPPPGATATPPVAPPQQYNSLFGDDDSDSSDDEGGLFGTGLPTSR